ncbi:hypothetical protein ACGFRB_24085 [Streptomyces sp. NPDC048718]|uniref:hypothetical protein n=1 Tax=Streptomyces sp. NPDC048718 TaxID=3365587 RepID=UPI0037229A37
MTISARVPYTWHCEPCGRERTASAWRIIDARERADVLTSPAPGVSWLDCPVCGTRTHIEAPLLVLRPGRVAPLLLAVSVAELQHGAPPSAPSLLEQAGRAGAFVGRVFLGQVIPLPRRLLPYVLARDLERDLTDPEAACRELRPEGELRRLRTTGSSSVSSKGNARTPGSRSSWPRRWAACPATFPNSSAPTRN